MCGIVGIVGQNKTVNTDLLEGMRDTFVYRGPDDCGAWYSQNHTVALGQRRLSIIDTSAAGHQPMVDAETGCVIVFNGEVYNYLEIRKELEQQGYSFQTKTDTEVVLKAYLAYGDECVHRFNGMFAIAIWDPVKARLFMLRDRVGIKPFYYYLSNDQLFFASEIKAIKHALVEPRGVNVGLIDQYMSFGYVPGEHTLLNGVKRLMPGHLAVYYPSSNVFETRQYWDLPDQVESDKGLEHYLESGKALLNDAIDLRLRSDVPLGIFLSGGIDSSAVVGLLAEKATEQLKTYSVAYDFGHKFDETAYARKVSKHFNTDHHELYIKPDSFRDFIPEYIRLMDEPVTESASIALYMLAKMTKQDVTVVLSGEGSDEVFAGYDWYRYMQFVERYRSVVGNKGANLLKSLAYLPGFKHSKIGKYLTLGAEPLHTRHKGISTYDERIKELLYLPGFRESLKTKEYEETAGFLQGLFENNRSSLNKMLYFDTKTWLVDDLLIKADRMSMAASLELRVPFLDYRVVEFGARLPTQYKINKGQGKYLLKKMVEGLLPNEIIYRKKMGFPTPLKLMFQGALKDYSSDLLLSSNSKVLQYFNKKGISYLLSEHQSGRHDYHRELWQLVVLEEWLQQNG